MIAVLLYIILPSVAFWHCIDCTSTDKWNSERNPTQHHCICINCHVMSQEGAQLVHICAPLIHTESVTYLELGVDTKRIS